MGACRVSAAIPPASGVPEVFPGDLRRIRNRLRLRRFRLRHRSGGGIPDRLHVDHRPLLRFARRGCEKQAASANPKTGTGRGHPAGEIGQHRADRPLPAAVCDLDIQNSTTGAGDPGPLREGRPGDPPPGQRQFQVPRPSGRESDLPEVEISQAVESALLAGPAITHPVILQPDRKKKMAGRVPPGLSQEQGVPPPAREGDARVAPRSGLQRSQGSSGPLPPGRESGSGGVRTGRVCKRRANPRMRGNARVPGDSVGSLRRTLTKAYPWCRFRIHGYNAPPGRERPEHQGWRSR